MINHLPADHLSFLRQIGKLAEQQKLVAYAVGGLVRDLLLGRGDGLDLDVVLEGDAIAFANWLHAHYGGQLTTHAAFGTATWQIAPTALGDIVDDSTELHVDLITARREVYAAPAALPTVYPSHLQDDLQRRDFTINTLAICLHPARWGELVDPCDGLADLRAGVIRVLHDASFVDDPTRILRAVRYEQRFGFVIEAHTLALVQSAIPLVDHLTPDRVRHEFERIFREAGPEKPLSRLAQLGLLAPLHPNWHFTSEAATHLVRLRAALGSPEIAPEIVNVSPEQLHWGVLGLTLTAPAQAALVTRLGLDRTTQRIMADMAYLHRQAAQLANSSNPPSIFVALIERSHAPAPALYQVLTEDEAIAATLRRYLATWQFVRPVLTGDDLRILGLPPGPRYRKILTALRNARLDGTVQQRADELALVQQLV